MNTAFLISEVKRAMLSIMETEEFPDDTCPADIYTYACELEWQHSGSVNHTECVAKACAYMNDAGLPNVHAMAEALASMIQLVRAMDANMQGCGGIASDIRVARAASILDNVAPHLASSIDWKG